FQIRLTNLRVETRNLKLSLLKLGIARCANPQLLSLIKTNVFAFLCQHTCSTDAGADGCANRRSGSAAGNQSDDRSDTSSRADFLHIAFSRTASLHAAFGINFADAFTGAVGNDFDHLRAHFRTSSVGQLDLVESQLQ